MKYELPKDFVVKPSGKIEAELCGELFRLCGLKPHASDTVSRAVYEGFSFRDVSDGEFGSTNMEPTYTVAEFAFMFSPRWADKVKAVGAEFVWASSRSSTYQFIRRDSLPGSNINALYKTILTRPQEPAKEQPKRTVEDAWVPEVGEECEINSELDDPWTRCVMLYISDTNVIVSMRGEEVHRYIIGDKVEFRPLKKCLAPEVSGWYLLSEGKTQFVRYWNGESWMKRSDSVSNPREPKQYNADTYQIVCKLVEGE